jgi:hypothetical protein
MIWFLRGETTGRVVDHLAATGAALAYPIGEGWVSVLDLEGTRELVSREAFMSLLQDNDAPTQAFQTWYSTSEDMVVTIHRNLTEVSSNATFYAVTCYLDGLELEQVEAAISGAAQLVSGSPEKVVGFVIDKRGGTEDFDWHAFMCDPSTVPPVPDRLVVQRAAIEGHPADRGAWSMGDPAPAFATLNDVRR